MQGRRRFFVIGQILLMTLMLSGMLELGAVAHASTLPQDATSVSMSAVGTPSAIHGGVAYADGIVSWHQLSATHLAKYPKAKSTLPCQPWGTSVAIIASLLRTSAEIPLQVFADTYCYAIHPRPPTIFSAA
ncbi:MAG: hypothetical protein ACYDCO_20830 [Armatimonadota bacterium]